MLVSPQAHIEASTAGDESSTQIMKVGKGAWERVKGLKAVVEVDRQEVKGYNEVCEDNSDEAKDGSLTKNR